MHVFMCTCTLETPDVHLLINVRPNGITIQQNSRNSLNGWKLNPLMFGFRTITELLQSIEELVVVSGHALFDWGQLNYLCIVSLEYVIGGSKLIVRDQMIGVIIICLVLSCHNYIQLCSVRK